MNRKFDIDSKTLQLKEVFDFETDATQNHNLQSEEVSYIL